MVQIYINRKWKKQFTERMKAFVESKEIAVPKCNSADEFNKWLMLIKMGLL